MRYGQNKTDSIHYFHSYAVADRINFSDLSETAPLLPNVSDEQLAISLLPSVEEDMAIHNNFATLVARALVRSLLMELSSGTSSMNSQQKCQRSQKL